MIHKDDEIFLMTFAMRASLIATSPPIAPRQNALMTGANVGSGTALADSLYQALQKVKQGRYQKKAILIVTDGEDTTSLTRFDKVCKTSAWPKCWSTASGSRAPGFDIEPIHFPETQIELANSTTVDMKVLNRFGEASGGRAWKSPGLIRQNMDAILDKIAAGPQPIQHWLLPEPAAKDGKWHEVKIRMKNPDYLARARKEYIDK